MVMPADTTTGIPEAPSAPAQVFDPEQGSVTDVTGAIPGSPEAPETGVQEPTQAKAPEQPTPQPQPDPAMQAQLEQAQARERQYQAQLAQYRQQEQAAQLQLQQQQYQRQLEDAGYTPEQAQFVAQQVIARHHSMQQQIAHIQAKQQTAVRFAKQYGLAIDDLEALMDFDTPQAMEAHAKAEQRIRRLEQDASAAKQAKVPPQTFDNNRAGAPSPQSYLSQLKMLSEKPVWTDADSELYRKLTAGR